MFLSIYEDFSYNILSYVIRTSSYDLRFLPSTPRSQASVNVHSYYAFL